MCGIATSSFKSSLYEVGNRYPITEVYGHLPAFSPTTEDSARV